MGEILFQKGLIEPDTLGKIISDVISIPFVNMDEEPIPDAILKIVPEQVAREQGLMAYKMTDKELYVAVVRSDNEELRDFLSKNQVFHSILRLLSNLYSIKL